MIETEGLMGIQRAAKYLGVHPNTLRNWERQKLLKPYRFGSRKDRRYAKWMLERIKNAEQTI